MRIRKRDLIIVGTGGHAVAALDLASQMNIRVIAFVKPPSLGLSESIPDVISGAPVISMLELQRHSSAEYFIAIGDNFRRAEIHAALATYGIRKFPNLISKSALISKDAGIGHGNFIGNFANIGPRSQVGNFTVINTRASCDHENVLADYCMLSPGATTGGKVHIGRYSFIGMNSVVRQGITIGENCLVGALSYVNKPVEDNSVSWGLPAIPTGVRFHGEKFNI
jgi:sugar O-acyltransferase (sialic acid O-acetyltransferase NeuD family)